ncbi:MAG: SH3 domain-containing protein [Chloroflexi bacterium]|nr:SH3 domain-containing protein [Chloroflexota bacterium]
MRRLRGTFILILITVGIAALLPHVTPAHAQGTPSWLQVWLIPGENQQLSTIEYRDASGSTLAAYTLSMGTFGWTYQGGGRVYGSYMSHVPIFDPTTGRIDLYLPPGKPADTDQLFYNLASPVPNPTGQNYAYTVLMQDSQMSQPSTSWVYVATPGGFDDNLIFEEDREPFMATVPMGWSADGTSLLLHDMPQGIGGYILFWQYQNIRALNLTTNVLTPLGNADGVSGDLSITARVERGDTGVTGLTVTQISSGQVTTYPLPDLGEQPSLGGGAFFSPQNSKVAYQVARGDPENEKFWTLVLDLTTGQQKVILEDLSVDFSVRYSNISGWLDDNTLVIGGPWNQQSAIMDANSGAVLREDRGSFIGYAQGITSTQGFAPSGMAYAQCPGAPLSRLTTFGRGRVTFTDGTLTNVRQSPSTTAEQVGSVPEGAEFSVVGGPDCGEAYTWWYVQFDAGMSGYVAEGDFNSYYLEPWP